MQKVRYDARAKDIPVCTRLLDVFVKDGYVHRPQTFNKNTLLGEKEIDDWEIIGEF